MRRLSKNRSSSLKTLLTKPACLCCNINHHNNNNRPGNDGDVLSETVKDHRRPHAAVAATNDCHQHRSRMLLHIDQPPQHHHVDGNCGEQQQCARQANLLDNMNSADAAIDLHHSQFSLFMQLYNNLNTHDLSSFKFLLNCMEPPFKEGKELNGLDLWQDSNLFMLIKILKFIIYLYLNFNVVNDKLPPLQHKDSPDNSQTSMDYDSDSEESLIIQIEGFIDQLYHDNKTIIGPRIVLNMVAIMEYIFSGLAVCTDNHNWRLTALMAFILSAKTNNDKTIRIKCFSQSLARMNLTEKAVIKIERDMLIKLNFNSIYSDAILCKIANDAAKILNESSS